MEVESASAMEGDVAPAERSVAKLPSITSSHSAGSPMRKAEGSKGVALSSEDVENALSVSKVKSTTSSVFSPIFDDEELGGIAAMADWLSQMILTDARFLRATEASRVVEYAGRALWLDKPTYYRHSRTVKEINKFISHSWQASAWSKMLTLLFFYNWKAAVIVSNLLVAVAMILFTFDFLPGFTKTPRFGKGPLYLGPWGLCIGIVSFVLVLVFRRPGEMVFLDRICINQADAAEKQRGVMNLGACLKHSKKLLVIWEATYSQRLLSSYVIACNVCFDFSSSSFDWFPFGGSQAPEGVPSILF